MMPMKVGDQARIRLVIQRRLAGMMSQRGSVLLPANSVIGAVD